jgi:hypothetical protein
LKPVRLRRVLGVALVAILTLAMPVQARALAISPGDSLVYSYSILTTYATPNGNVSNTFTSQEQISILKVNTSAPLGEVGYTETLLNFNGTQETTSTSSSNFTTIFDPYNNLTYLGNIGFWPFIYTDVQAGSRRNLEISASYNNSTVTYHANQYVNASVARASGIIGVNVTLLPSLARNSTAHPAIFRMHYNATTGVLKDYVEYANIFSIYEKIFTYRLVSYIHPAPPSYWFVTYVVVGAIAVVAAVAILGRKSAAERRGARIRERLAKAH